jgi:xanthine dehydrogenase accessory factor
MNEVISAIAQSSNLRAVAIIVGQHGPAYRPLGAMMAIYDDGRFEGHVSSGCIEADIIAHSENLKAAKVLTYGSGSPFVDLKLPCGGAMDVLLVPSPDQMPFQQVEATLNARRPSALCFDLGTGAIAVSDALQTNVADQQIHIYCPPPLRFLVFGNGFEAQVFAELTQGAGYPVALFSTSSDTIERSQIPRDQRHLMTRSSIPDSTEVDRWTSITLFFHDHDLEEDILKDALTTEAFYIGAQGSLRTQSARLANLTAAGVTGLDRIRGPIGLIPKSRDAQTLAISVLAEIHAVAGQATL